MLFRSRFLFLAIIVYRIGAHIPVPGINPDRLADLNAEQIDLSIQLMQALGGGYEPGNTATAVPTQASLAE